MRIETNSIRKISFLIFNLLFAATSTANQRLDQVQATYFQGVDTFISSQVEKILIGHHRAIETLGKNTLAELGAQAKEIETNLAKIASGAQSPSDFTKFLKEQQRLSQTLLMMDNTARASRDGFGRMKFGLDRLNHNDICAASARAILMQLVPQYQLDENIDISGIPQPKHYGVRASVGSDIEAADTTEKALYLPATLGGCAAGQAILWFLPVIGCIVGAAAGGGVAYGAGKATTAVMTGIENQKEVDAYNQAVAVERARQQAEIDQARAWMREHPISDEVIISRTLTHCLKQPFELPANILAQAEEWVKASDGVVETIKTQAEQIAVKRDEIRTQSLDAMKTQNDALVKAQTEQLWNRSEVEVRQDKLRELRQTLATCLVRDGSTCYDIAICVEESESLYNMLGFADASVAAELAQIHQDIEACNAQ